MRGQLARSASQETNAKGGRMQVVYCWAVNKDYGWFVLNTSYKQLYLSTAALSNTTACGFVELVLT